MIIPFWVYLAAAGVLLSAYMAIKSGREEKRYEDETIELEGRVYMERIEKEREERKQTVG